MANCALQFDFLATVADRLPEQFVALARDRQTILALACMASSQVLLGIAYMISSRFLVEVANALTMVLACVAAISWKAAHLRSTSECDSQAVVEAACCSVEAELHAEELEEEAARLEAAARRLEEEAQQAVRLADASPTSASATPALEYSEESAPAQSVKSVAMSPQLKGPRWADLEEDDDDFFFRSPSPSEASTASPCSAMASSPKEAKSEVDSTSTDAGSDSEASDTSELSDHTAFRTLFRRRPVATTVDLALADCTADSMEDSLIWVSPSRGKMDDSSIWAADSPVSCTYPEGLAADDMESSLWVADSPINYQPKVRTSAGHSCATKTPTRPARRAVRTSW